MKKSPKVFIVILNYNGKDFIKKCLSSVFKVDYSNFEVVFVDNGSTDGSLEIAKTSFSKAIFIKNEENLGYAAGNNIGIRFSLERMADYVLVLNNDTEVETDFLTNLVDVMEDNSEIGVASPIILDGNTKEVWFSGGRIDWMHMRTEHLQKVEEKAYYESEFITGCSIFVRAEVFQKIGLFDEDFFLYWEDADFSWRSKKAGFKNVVVSSSWINHFEKSEGQKKAKIYWLVVSGLIFFKKHSSFWRLPWLTVYLKGRKMKNWLDVKFSRTELALTVQKAYKDYEALK